MTEETRTRITQVRTVGVPVTDQDRALGFYAGTLGLEKRLDVPVGDGGRWVEVAPAGATTAIAAGAPSGNPPHGHDPRIPPVTADAAGKDPDLPARGGDAGPEVRPLPGLSA